jgi:hypothetical protein
MTGSDFEAALYRAATDAVELTTSLCREEAAAFATGLLDGARFGGIRIETVDEAVSVILHAQDAACTRAEAVG